MVKRNEGHAVTSTKGTGSRAKAGHVQMNLKGTVCSALQIYVHRYTARSGT
jgi:hypothetical protein